MYNICNFVNSLDDLDNIIGEIQLPKRKVVFPGVLEDEEDEDPGDV